MKLMRKIRTLAFVALAMIAIPAKPAGPLRGSCLEEIQADVRQELQVTDAERFDTFNTNFDEAVVNFAQNYTGDRAYSTLVAQLEQQAVQFDSFMGSVRTTDKLEQLHKELHELCALLRSYVGASRYSLLTLTMSLAGYRHLAPRYLVWLKANKPDRYYQLLTQLKELK